MINSILCVRAVLLLHYFPVAPGAPHTHHLYTSSSSPGHNVDQGELNRRLRLSEQNTRAWSWLAHSPIQPEGPLGNMCNVAQSRCCPEPPPHHHSTSSSVTEPDQCLFSPAPLLSFHSILSYLCLYSSHVSFIACLTIFPLLLYVTNCLLNAGASSVFNCFIIMSSLDYS